MWRIRILAAKALRLCLVSFISKVQIQRVDTGKRAKSWHAYACTHASMHTLCFLGDFFFFLHPAFSFSLDGESVGQVACAQIQVMLPRHIPVCCPTAESCCDSKPKQGVAIPLPACPLLSAHCRTVGQQGSQRTGGALTGPKFRGTVCNAFLAFKWEERSLISHYRVEGIN